MSVSPTPRRRPWLVALPLILVLVLAAGWSGFWFYAAARAMTTLDAWRAREAQAGRSYACGQQAVGGFPFRFEVACDAPRMELSSNNPPISAQASRVHIAGQVYDPTLLIAEIDGPVTIAITGQPPVHASWTLAQMSLRGVPTAPQRLSLVLHDAAFEQRIGTAVAPLLRASRLELHARMASGTVNDRPVIEFAVTMVGATAPNLHPLMNEPLDLLATAVLRGLDNLRPLPLQARLRQLQAAGGRLEITQSRIRQGEVIAVAAGALGLTPQGRPDGELRLTAAGLDRVLSKLGIDKIMPSQGAGRLEPAFGALDRLIPGLGRAARNNAGLGLAAGLALIGEPAELDGQKALALPLRFVDGAVFLGPLQVGQIVPLF
jgi:hypothetical protein